MNTTAASLATATLAPAALSWPLLLQYMLIALAAIASGWWLLRSLAPGFERKVRIAVALPLLRPKRPVWLRALGRRIAPAPQRAGGCSNCGTGCEPRR
jgi:hypothetical protein